MGKCVHCERRAGLFRRAHRKCQEECALGMASLMRSGRFREAAEIAEKTITLDPTLTWLASGLLSNVYFTAMCNSKEAEVRDAPSRARSTFRGLEEQLRSMNPSLYRYIYEEEEPSKDELEYTSQMHSCTLDTLGCSYALAREKAERHTRAVLAIAKSGSPDYLGARERYQTIGMMDEMYGVEGGKRDCALSEQTIQDIPEQSSEVLEVLYSHWRYYLQGGEYGQIADFSYADLSGVDFSRSALEDHYDQGVRLGKLNLNVDLVREVMNMIRGDLGESNFTGANLCGANFDRTNLYGAVLAGANLTGANLTDTNFGIGSLAYAELVGANLTGARLGHTSLEAANLADASGLTQDQIESANIDEFTRLPDYLRGLTRQAQETAGFDVNLPPFTEAIHLQPQNAREYFYRGLAFFHDGSLRRAIMDFSELLNIETQNPQGHHYLGISHYYDGQYDLAINSFSELIRLAPQNPLAYNHRANCYLKLSQHQQAIEDYSAAILLDPQTAIFYSNRSDAHRSHGNETEAQRDLEQASQLLR